MLYYQDDEITIRTIRDSDAQIICDKEIAQGWNQTTEKYLTRIADNASGRSVGLVAEYRGQVAGYVNVYINSAWGPFGGSGMCEIVDFGVLEKFRRRGIGSKLMDVAEEIAAGYNDSVYLGVGLHSGYGSAQRMYVKRGYIPDGGGAYYNDESATPYASYPLDDGLILYLSKKLR